MTDKKLAENDATRCTTVTAKGRRCKLEIHNDTVKHVYVDRSGEKLTLAQVMPKGYVLTATEVKPGETLKKSVGKRADTMPRDADQKRVDSDAAKNAAKNTGKSTQSQFEHLKLTQYIVPPTAKDVVLAYIRRATGTGGPETVRGKAYVYRTGERSDGNIDVQWAIVTRVKE